MEEMPQKVIYGDIRSDQKEWRKFIQKIIDNGLGIRSGSDENDLKGAVYAMDDEYKSKQGKVFWNTDKQSPIPHQAEWSKHLKDTIEYMMSFPEFQIRYLILVWGVSGSGNERYGFGDKKTFLKTSCSGHLVKSRVFGNDSAELLIKWVIDEINAIPENATAK